MMGCDFQYRERVPVALLGATGGVGQYFLHLLQSHPWFSVTSLAASPRSAGKRYGEAAHWAFPYPVPELYRDQTLLDTTSIPETSLIFSALDAAVAGEIEQNLSERGRVVVSNCRNHRMDPNVPLVVPEVNSDHLALFDRKSSAAGKILTNPNCSAVALAMVLKPLQNHFGLEAVNVVTLQATSGAGLQGQREMDIADNVIPYIVGEEEKIEREIKKLLGTYQEGRIVPAELSISAQCNRVPVSDGHLQCVSVKLQQRVTAKEVIEAWKTYVGVPQKLELPSAPKQPLHYFEDPFFPQTKHHRQIEKGMAVAIGRLRECPLFDFKFVVLSHNMVRGAAGCAILNAELLLKQGCIYW